MTTEQLKCEQRIDKELKDRIEDLIKLWKAEQEGEEDPDLGRFNEYGLSFDYVAPNTFKEQEQGYFRYQLSWGGPSDEFRFYVNPDLSAYHVEYVFMDWFDGATRELSGDNKRLLLEIYEDFRECGLPQSLIKEAKEE